MFSDDRDEYILSLRHSQDEETSAPFLAFMAQQLKKSLLVESERLSASRTKGFTFLF